MLPANKLTRSTLSDNFSREDDIELILSYTGNNSARKQPVAQLHRTFSYYLLPIIDYNVCYVLLRFTATIANFFKLLDQVPGCNHSTPGVIAYIEPAGMIAIQFERTRLIHYISNAFSLLSISWSLNS